MSKDCGKIRQLSLIGENNSYSVKHITPERERNMRFLATFKKSCDFERWLKLVDDLKPHMNKHGLKLIVAMESEDGTRIYDLGEAETMEGVEAFVSDPEVIRMRADAGVDTESQEVIAPVGKYHIFD